MVRAFLRDFRVALRCSTHNIRHEWRQTGAFPRSPFHNGSFDSDWSFKVYATKTLSYLCSGIESTSATCLPDIAGRRDARRYRVPSLVFQSLLQAHREIRDVMHRQQMHINPAKVTVAKQVAGILVIQLREQCFINDTESVQLELWTILQSDIEHARYKQFQPLEFRQKSSSSRCVTLIGVEEFNRTFQCRSIVSCF